MDLKRSLVRDFRVNNIPFFTLGKRDTSSKIQKDYSNECVPWAVCGLRGTVELDGSWEVIKGEYVENDLPLLVEMVFQCADIFRESSARRFMEWRRKQLKLSAEGIISWIKVERFGNPSLLWDEVSCYCSNSRIKWLIGMVFVCLGSLI